MPALIFPAPGAPGGTQFTATFVVVGANTGATVASLNTFDSGFLQGEIVVPATLTVTNSGTGFTNIVSNYIYDGDVFTYTNVVVTTKTLIFAANSRGAPLVYNTATGVNSSTISASFNSLDTTVIPFRTGSTVKFISTLAGFVGTYTVANGGYNFVTIESANNIPLVSDLVISSLPTVYTQSQVYTELAPRGLLSTAVTPRENLFASTVVPNRRGVKYFIDRSNGYIVPPVRGSLEIFDNISIAGDTYSSVTTQSPNTVTTNTNIVYGYIYDTDTITYSSNTATNKTIYFSIVSGGGGGGGSYLSTLSVMIATTVTTAIEYLVVGGGGNGGGDGGGGGGAGGVVQGNTSVSSPSIVTVTVGAGGGNSSYFGSVRAYGGGGGGSARSSGGSGASGGGSGTGCIGRWGNVPGKGIYPGSSYISAARQGYDGGAGGNGADTAGTAGGGGGSGGAGVPGTNFGTSGSGGGGTTIGAGQFTVSAFSVAAGGGGGGNGGTYGYGAGSGGGSGAGNGGAPYPDAVTGGSGSPNTGSGGGGGGGFGGGGGAGGSGIVTIAYPDVWPDLNDISGLVTQRWTGSAWVDNVAGVTTAVTNVRSGYKIYRFVSGTGTISFPTALINATITGSASYPQNSNYIPFAVGSRVKITSASLGYANTFTVLDSGYNYVTFANPAYFPSYAPDLIVSNLPQVYPQLTPVITRPTSPRENFYYFNLAPGYRNNKSVTGGQIIGTTLTPISVSAIKPGTPLKSGDSAFGTAANLKSSTPLKDTRSVVNSGNVRIWEKIRADRVSQGNPAPQIQKFVHLNNQVFSNISLVQQTGDYFNLATALNQSGSIAYQSTNTTAFGFPFPTPATVDVLIVGGGGGGGSGISGYPGGGGGGGGGGFRCFSSVPISPLGQYVIVVGGGGAAAACAGGSTGGDSSAFGYTSAGSGGGGSGYILVQTQPTSGGSGGGGGSYQSGAAGNVPPTVPVQGYPGATGCSGRTYGGGGGGASGTGITNGCGVNAIGGPGRQWAVNASYYSGGGGGGNTAGRTASPGGIGGGGIGGGGGCISSTSGSPATGGGGGGGPGNSGLPGGGGVVIVRYFGQPVAYGGRVVVVNDYTLHIFSATSILSFYTTSTLATISANTLTTNFNRLISSIISPGRYGVKNTPYRDSVGGNDNNAINITAKLKATTVLKPDSVSSTAPGKVRQFTYINEASTAIATGKATLTPKLHTDNATILTSAINKFTVPSNNISLAVPLDRGLKLNSVAKIAGDRVTLSTDKIRVVAPLKSLTTVINTNNRIESLSTNSNFDNNSLYGITTRIPGLRGRSLNYQNVNIGLNQNQVTIPYAINNLTTSLTVTTNLPPVNVRENLYYSLVAAGRYGRSYQINNQFGDIANTIQVNAAGTYTNTSDLLYSRLFPSGIPSLSNGINYKTPILNLVASQLPEDRGALNYFHNQGEIVDTFNLTGFGNTSYNIPTWYIYDYDAVTKIVTTGSSQILYYRNTSDKRFAIGNYVRIDKTSVGYSTVTQITSLVVNGIVVSVSGLPATPEGVTITDVSSPVYTKNSVYNNLISNANNYKNTVQPRDNLFASELKPRLRPAIDYYLDRQFSDNLTNVGSTRSQLEFFSDINLVGDIVLPISGRSPNILTTGTNVVANYIYDRDTITYNQTPTTQKTIFFSVNTRGSIDIAPSVVICASNVTLEVLIVGGGGGGGQAATCGSLLSSGGGGGGGGALYGTIISASTASYAVAIGGGGPQSSNGQPTTFSQIGSSTTYTALGGGAGGGTNSGAGVGSSGGTGGGGGGIGNGSGTQTSQGGLTGYGNPGGAGGTANQIGGGGGGLGASGNAPVSDNSAGVGGTGRFFSCVFRNYGVNGYFGGGGGGGGTLGICGGTPTNSGGYRYQHITATTPMIVNAQIIGGIDLLIVGGGGGGGAAGGGAAGGGGGGGGVLFGTTSTINATSYNITVGGGGGSTASGTPSSAFGLTANGGGAGGSSGGAGSAGGSGGGGGGGSAGTANQTSNWLTGYGNSGGTGGGPLLLGAGGGGAGGGGGSYNLNLSSGNGGAGVFISQFSSYGSGGYFGAGGGGGGCIASCVASPYGQAVYTTPGTYNWYVPKGVTTISAVVIGGGGSGGGGGSIPCFSSKGGGGGGGGLGWSTFSVNPGDVWSVTVGPGAPGTAFDFRPPGFDGSSTYITLAGSTKLIAYGGLQGKAGGNSGGFGAGGVGGSYASFTGAPSGGFTGGTGGSPFGDFTKAGSGGGAATYVGNGGNGALAFCTDGGGGGGTGVYGGGLTNSTGGSAGGAGGSGGNPGSPYVGGGVGGGGGGYGGGGGGGGRGNPSAQGAGGPGGSGAVRFIWGTGRAFPATDAASSTVVGSLVTPGSGGTGGAGFGNGCNAVANTGSGGGGGSKQSKTTGGQGGSGAVIFRYQLSLNRGGSNIGGNGGVGGGAGAGSNGTAFTGGGGGGGRSGGTTIGGQGGSGIVLVAYPGLQRFSGGNVSSILVSSQSYTVHSFQSSGNFTANTIPPTTSSVSTSFNSQNINYIPFAVGSTVKVVSASLGYLNTFTVVAASYNSVTFDTAATIPTATDLVVSNLPSVYPIISVVTNTAPVNARQNLYYSQVAPGKRSSLSVNQGIYYASDSNRFLPYSLRSAAKVAFQSSPITVGKTSAVSRVTPGTQPIIFTGKLATVSKLRSDAVIAAPYFVPGQFLRKPIIRGIDNYVTRTVSSVATTTAVVYDTVGMAVSGRTKTVTNNVINWYIQDQDIFVQLPAGTSLVTLYFVNNNQILGAGSSIKIRQFNKGYEQNFSVVSVTNTTVTLVDPGNLPSISSMYVYWGRTVTSDAATYTNNNSVPLINRAATSSRDVVFSAPQLGKTRSVITVKTDRTTLPTSRLEVFDNILPVTVPTFGQLPPPPSVEYLVVGGGGSGGVACFYWAVGGGGAGGMTTGTSVITSVAPYPVTIGSGGAAIAYRGLCGAGPGLNGGNSVFAAITAIGGGAGGITASNGGSGGGGGVIQSSSIAYGGGTGITGQGNPGGPAANSRRASGSGGGAGGPGISGSTQATPAAGGVGLQSSITGVSKYYAGGGAAGSGGNDNPGGFCGAVALGGLGGGGAGGRTCKNGTPNTGGGGGGGVSDQYYPTGGGAGGSGIVIIAYRSIYAPISQISSGLSFTLDTTTRAGYRVYSFTSGTGVISWPDFPIYAYATWNTGTNILITGKTSSYTNNAVSGYTYDQDILSISRGSQYIPVILSYNSTATITTSTVKLFAASGYNTPYTVTTSTAGSITVLANPYTLPSTLYINQGVIQLTFDSQTVIPFNSGRYVTIVNSLNRSTTVQVITGTNSSITFATPIEWFDYTGSLLVYSASADVLPRLSASNRITGIVANSRQRLYYSELVNSGGISGAVVNDVNPRTITGQGNIFVGQLSKQVVKLAADRTTIQAAKLKYITALKAAETTASRTVTSVTTASSIVYSTIAMPVSGRTKTVTNNVINWYIQDQDILVQIPTGTTLVTLYFNPGSYYDVGTAIKVRQFNKGYEQTFSVVNATNRTVTFIDPGNLPSISSMYVYWGSTVITNTAIYTDTNTVPVVGRLKVPATLHQTDNKQPVFNTPSVNKLTAIQRLKGDTNRYIANKFAIKVALKPTVDNIKNYNLSTFDNTGLVTGPYAVSTGTTDPGRLITGRTSGYTNDVVLWYAQDRDRLTLTSVTTSTVTLNFSAASTVPYPTGSSVILYSANSGYTKELTVVTGTVSSITVLDPGGLPSISGLYVSRNETNYDVTVYFPLQQYTAEVVTAVPDINIDYLLVGGGAGATGGVCSVNYGGGGAGGTLRASANSITIRTGLYSVVVGSGGIGVASGTPQSGSPSTITINGFTYSATGGNGSNSLSNVGGSNADYSGGSASGLYGSGGGAGAGGNGGANNSGGVGATSSISGTLTYYGGGGGGVSGSGGSAVVGTGGTGGGAPGGSNGLPNTGGGAGGTSSGAFTNGGSGIVIVRYPGAQKATGGTVTSALGYTVHTFTATGALTVNAAISNVRPIPYDIGSYVQMTNSAINQTVTVAVTGAGANYFTYRKTYATKDFSFANTTSIALASASIPVYLAANVRPTNNPTLPRDNLYFSQVAQGYRGRANPSGLLFTGQDAANGLKSATLNKVVSKLTYSGNLLQSQLEKFRLQFSNISDVGSDTLKITVPNEFDAGYLLGDLALTVVNQTPNIAYTNTNIVRAYIYDQDTVTYSTGTATYKTVYFNQPSTTAVNTFSYYFYSTIPVEYIVVGGGGGGGGAFAGGGGAGGFLTNTGTAFSIVANSSYTVIVGGGGTGGLNTKRGTSGSTSTFGSFNALGGGAGGGWNGLSSYPNGTGEELGLPGGSGGGGTSKVTASAAGTPGQGNRGGAGQSDNSSYDFAGGGGGAGSAGGIGSAGAGAYSSITGFSVAYAGGGGSAGTSQSAGGVGGGGNGAPNGQAGGAGTPFTGGGGGGGNGTGGNGGSGIVVVRYLGEQKATGGTVTTASGYTIHSFTATTSLFVFPAELITSTVTTVTTSTQIPYQLGQQVKVTSQSLSYVGTFTVVDSGLNYVTFSNPGNFPYSTDLVISNLPIVYPQSQVKITTRPTNARERLYYAQIAQGYKSGTLITPYGSIIQQDSTATSVSSGRLERWVVPANQVIDVSRNNLTLITPSVFDDARLIGDFSLGIVKLSAAIGTTNTNIVPSYIYDRDIFTYTLTSATNDTVYFNTTSTSAVNTSSYYFYSTSTVLSLDYLVVAGGGGGGTPRRFSSLAGGGGGGGLLTGSTGTTAGASYIVVVGSGGAASIACVSNPTSGTNSTFITANAVGGGYGYSWSVLLRTAGNGGSGGGGFGGGQGTAGQGNPGSSINGGGGGGAGTAGGVGYFGNGGDGLASSITSVSTYYAGGGAGSGDGYCTFGVGGLGGGGNVSSSYTIAGGNGTPYTGGGGAAGILRGASFPNQQSSGGAGGGGIVIVRYLGAQKATGGAVTTASGYTIHSFTATSALVFQSLFPLEITSTSTVVTTNTRVPFQIGQQVKVTSNSLNYANTFTVADSGINYVKFTKTIDFAYASDLVISNLPIIYPQSSVSTVKSPTNARENLYYAQTAQGRYGVLNTLYGNSGATAGTVPLTSRLDNIIDGDASSAPTFTIVGQDSGTTADTVLYYTYDRDVFTVGTRTVTNLVLYFNNSSSTSIPYATGSQVILRRSDEPLYYLSTILGSGNNYVIVARPSGYDVKKWRWNTVSVAGVELYPQANVRTTTAPINARQNLYYAQMSQGRLSSINTYGGNVGADIGPRLVNEFLQKSVSALKADSAVLRADLITNRILEIVRGDRVTRFNTGALIWKTSYIPIQAFYTPQIGKLRLITPLKSDSISITYSQLQKQLAILRGDAAISGRAGILNLKVKSNTVQVFNPPQTPGQTRIRIKLDGSLTTTIINRIESQNSLTNRIVTNPTDAISTLYWIQLAPGFRKSVPTTFRGAALDETVTTRYLTSATTLSKTVSILKTSPAGTLGTIFQLPRVRDVNSELVSRSLRGLVKNVVGPLFTISITGAVAPNLRKTTPVVDVTGDSLVVNKQGLIEKLKTGSFKSGSVGIHDPSAKKKEPIQFWN